MQKRKDVLYELKWTEFSLNEWMIKGIMFRIMLLAKRSEKAFNPWQIFFLDNLFF